MDIQKTIDKINEGNRSVIEKHEFDRFYDHISTCFTLLEEITGRDISSLNLRYKINGNEIGLYGLGTNGSGVKNVALIILDENLDSNNHLINVIKRSNSSGYTIHNDVGNNYRSMETVSQALTDFVLKTYDSLLYQP